MTYHGFETREEYNAYMLAWHHKNKEKVKGWKKGYYLENREKFLEKQRQYRQDNKEKIRVSVQEYKHKHKEWARLTVNKSAWKLKLAILSYYSKGTLVCAHCGETDLRVLQIDHIDGNGNEHRRTIGGSGKVFYRWLKQQEYPKGYQVLCANCNIRKLYLERNLYCGELDA